MNEDTIVILIFFGFLALPELIALLISRVWDRRGKRRKQKKEKADEQS